MEYSSCNRQPNRVAVGTGLTDNGDHSNITLLDAKSLRVVWSSVRIPYELTHLEFVSQDFGFLAAVWANPIVFKDIAVSSQASLVQVRYNSTFDVLIDKIPGRVTSLAVTPDRQLVAVCSEAQGKEDATCRVFRLSDRKLLWTWSPTYCQRLSVVFTNDSQQCFLATQESHHLESARAPPAKNDTGMRVFLVSANNGTLLQREEWNDSRSLGHQPFLAASSTDPEAFALFHREIRKVTFQNNGFVSETLLSTNGLNALHAYPVRIDFNPKCGFLPFASTGDHREGHQPSIWFLNRDNGSVSDRRVFRYDLSSFRISPDGKLLYVLHPGGEGIYSEVSIYDLQNL